MTAQIRPPAIVDEIDALLEQMRAEPDWLVLRYQTPAHILWLFKQYPTYVSVEGDSVYNFAHLVAMVCAVEVHYDWVTGEVTAYRTYPEADPEPIDWRSLDTV